MFEKQKSSVILLATVEIFVYCIQIQICKRNAICENILNETSVKNNMRYFTPMLIFIV